MTLRQDDSGTAAAGGVAAGDLPTTGGMRPGPGRRRANAGGGPGIVPVAMVSDALAIDNDVYAAEVVDGAMQDPTGPFVVAWYQSLGKLGQNGNVVVAGHVDYYTVGEAVFWRVKEPGARVGDLVTLVGEDGSQHVYEVQRSRTYATGDLTAEVIQRQITGATRTPTLTIITCGGDFDAISGEYLARIAVRCSRVQVIPPTV